MRRSFKTLRAKFQNLCRGQGYFALQITQILCLKKSEILAPGLNLQNKIAVAIICPQPKARKQNRFAAARIMVRREFYRNRLVICRQNFSQTCRKTQALISSREMLNPHAIAGPWPSNEILKFQPIDRKMRRCVRISSLHRCIGAVPLAAQKCVNFKNLTEI